MRLAVDTGGTFTDLVVEDDDGALRIFKSPTTPDDPSRGVLDVLASPRPALASRSTSCSARSSVFIHGTTRAINAVLTGSDGANRASSRPQGHPDILVFREGGRTDPFDFTRALSRAVRPARADLRGAGADRRGRARSSSRSTRTRCVAICERAARAARRGGRASACSGRSSTRRTSCASASCSPSTCRASRSRCRTSSTRRSASTAAPRRPASTRR